MTPITVAATSETGTAKHDAPAPVAAPPRLMATYRVPVTVWTSEGHTNPQDAIVNVDDTFRPCPKEPGNDKPTP